MRERSNVPADSSQLMIMKSASCQRWLDPDPRLAHRRLARANHPDHNPGDPAAVRRFGEVSEAYEVLSARARLEECDAKIKSAS